MFDSLTRLNSPPSSDISAPPTPAAGADSSSTRCLVALTGAIIAVALFATLPPLPFFTRGDAREGQVIADIVQHGRWVLPLRNGTEIPSKPPLFHWIGALISLLFGLRIEIAARTGSLLAMLVALVTVYRVFRRHSTMTTATLAIATLVTAFEWYRSSTSARVDMVFASAAIVTTLALFSLVERYRETRNIPRAPYFGAIAGTIAAVLAKGPAGLVLPWLTAGIYAVMALGWKQLPWRAVALALACAVAGSAVWYYLAWRQSGHAFLEVQLMRENVARLAGLPAYDTGHKSPWYSVVLLLAAGYLPWSIFMPLCGAHLWQERRMIRFDPLAKLSLIWTAVYLVVFAVASSKRTVYLLPAYPAVAYLLAASLSDVLTPERTLPRFAILTRRLLVVLAIILATAITTATLVARSGVVPILAERFLKRAADRDAFELIATQLSTHPLHSLVLFMAAAMPLTCLALLADRTLRVQILYVSAALFTFCTLVAMLVLPAYARFASPREFAAFLQQRTADSTPITQFETEYYALNFYLGRSVPIVTKSSTSPISAFVVYEKAKQSSAEAALGPLEVLHISDDWDVYGRDHFVLARFTNRIVPIPAQTAPGNGGGIDTPAVSPVETNASDDESD